MKNRNIIYIVAVAVAFVSCHSGFEKAVTPELEISLEKEVYFTDDAVTFNINSDADFISFYSGENGNDYEYASKDRIYQGELYLSFSSAFQAGQQYKRQQDEDHTKKMLRLFWSVDFSGEYTKEAVDAATWNELTSLANYPETRADNAKLLSNAVPSGEIDVTDLIKNDGKPVYFAFKYMIEAYDEVLGNSRSRASVFNFLVKSKAEEVNAVEDVFTHAKAGWQFILNGYGSSEKIPENTTSYLWFDCDSGITNDLECWAISAPVPLTNEVNVGCDYGIGIKSFVDEPLKEYTYTYSKPGTYDVCFVAAKVDHEGTRKETVRNLKVVVSDHGNASIVQPDNGGVWE